ncbi:MAG TPA: hypothetical protein VNH20_09200 [Candidatus Dormibacteraeota bacterium]|nr:hypothetical protein [Candidatus Dormibacteraeota bacterium]
MAGDCPVCGERLADGVVTRSYPVPVPGWWEELAVPPGPGDDDRNPDGAAPSS